MPGARFPRDRARQQAGESLLLRHLKVAILTKWQPYLFIKKGKEMAKTQSFQAFLKHLRY